MSSIEDMNLQYEPLEVIGSGSFGLIRKIRRKSDGKILARKELNFHQMSEKERQQLVAEVNILRGLRHPNIVRYYERFVDKERGILNIIMEWCGGGDLGTLIRRCKKEGKYIGEDIIWNFFTQIVMALHECHIPKGERNVVLHRDIKPDNVFLDSNGNVKLGDFGLSRVLDPEKSFAMTFVGTPYYMSPELMSESTYNTKSDIWALGCLLFEMCSLEPPFKAKTHAQLAARIKQGIIPPLPAQYSQEVGRVIKSMLQLNPAKRPSTGDFFKLDRMRLCHKEREIYAYHQELKRREEELKKREVAFEAREKEILEREAAVAKKEEELRQKEARLMDIDKRPGRISVEERSTTNVIKSTLHATRTPQRRKSFISAYGARPPIPSAFSDNKNLCDVYPTAETLYGEDEEMPSPFIRRQRSMTKV
ncbi:uncharacterized protein VTP21DRAFT_2651 [Calcarisporiella thermophila]|uniref:uncharacterized protein n=1 Tax=Calcarisporiella thermophila TaxID=911321 RepID=UPI003742F854